MKEECTNLILTEYLTKEDTENGVSLSDAGGIIFADCFNQLGLRRNDYIIEYVYSKRNSIKTPAEFDHRFKVTQAQGKKEGLIKWGEEYVKESLLQEYIRVQNWINQSNITNIIACGEYALRFLTGEKSIGNWRGSLLEANQELGFKEGVKVLPTYNPTQLAKKYEWNKIIKVDLQRAKNYFNDEIIPVEEYIDIPHSFHEASQSLQTVLTRFDKSSEPVPVAQDIETWRGTITVFGMATSSTSALVIPFLHPNKTGKNYWDTPEEEREITNLILRILTHKKLLLIGQNWNYDSQYIAKLFGLFRPADWDTMIHHHTKFPGLQKSLDFQSSIYLEDHKFWKNEGRKYRPDKDDPEQYWIYNGRDCLRTYRIYLKQKEIEGERGKPPTKYGHPVEIQHRLQAPVLAAECRGIRVDRKVAERIATDCIIQISRREAFIERLIGREINVKSPKQMQELFYAELGQKKVLKWNSYAGKYTVTTDEDALNLIARREPLLTPLCRSINEVRQLNTALSVATKKLDADGRLRCSYQIPGTHTFRFTSSTDAFGFGTNLQNVSQGTEDQYTEEERKTVHYTPNLRKMFVPDRGMTIVDFDLQQADAAIVAKEAGEESLLNIILDPEQDLHNVNCAAIFGKCKGKSDPNRKLSKMGVHLTNYGGTVHTLATSLGITQKKAAEFQNKYFSRYPGISDWHERVQTELETTRSVTNIFGYKRYFFERMDTLLKVALAWVPQSTVGIVTNLGILNVWDNYPWLIQFLLQCHDSAGFQFPTSRKEECIEKTKACMEIELPYPTPLTIPVSYKLSTKSWGEC